MIDPAVITSLAQLDKDRMRAYQQNLDFYQGTQWQGSARGSERRLTFNYAKVFIDKITSYLMSGIAFAIDPREEGEEAQGKARRAEQAIYKVYEDENLSQLDFDTEIDCAVLGDAAYKVTWDVNTKSVRVTTPDVQGLYAWWYPDDVSRLWRVASRYQLEAAQVELLYNHIPSGKKAWVVEVWTDKTFELWIDNAQIVDKPNPYGFIPFVIFPNLREPKQFWGKSDIPIIVEPQRELNRALSQLSRILELSGNPIAVLENIQSAEDIQVQPGATWVIPEDAKAYLLDLLQGGGVRLHIDYIDTLYRVLHDISEAPRSAFGGIERDISGVALEIDLQPLVQKAKRKRLIRTAAYKKRNEMILKLIEQFTAETFGDISHRIIWSSIIPQDTARMVQGEQMMVQTGIHSRRRAMDEMGIQDPDNEFDRWLEERARILAMNKELSARSSRGGARERALESKAGEGGAITEEGEV